MADDVSPEGENTSLKYSHLTDIYFPNVAKNYIVFGDIENDSCIKHIYYLANIQFIC